MDGCLTLTIVGGAAEIVGFALAFWEMRVTQRREFPGYRPWYHRAFAWVRRKLGLAKPRVIEGEGTVTVTASVTGTADISREPGATLEARVELLEQDVKYLTNEQRQDHDALESRIGQTDQRIGETETALRTEMAEMEAQRKETLRESITYEKAGISLFVVGVILSVLGNAVTC